MLEFTAPVKMTGVVEHDNEEGRNLSVPEEDQLPFHGLTLFRVSPA